MTIRRITEPAREYVTPHDEERERSCMKEFAEHYGGTWRKLPTAPRGSRLLRHNRIDYESDTCIAEFKSRIGSHGGRPLYAYGSVDPFLSAAKYNALIERASYTKKVPIFVVEFVDGLGYIYVWLIGGKQIMTNNRMIRVAQDNEPTYLAPIRLFNWVRRKEAR